MRIVTPLIAAFARALCLAALTLPAAVTTLHAADKEELYEGLEDRLFKIKTVDRSSDAKAAIGSGFLVRDSGVIATNYHVVAEKLRKPDKYKLTYTDADDESGELEVIALDVVRDLALVKGEVGVDAAMEVVTETPSQGASIYALGNPLDLGMSIVQGSYNGINDDSIYRKMLFSGALNPGMSGGPAVDEEGRVVGVNVARTGEDIGFLVPAEALASLIERADGRGFEAPDSFDKVIEEQLAANQNQYMGELLQGEWETVALGPARVPGKLASFLDCSGGSSDEGDGLYEGSRRQCSNRYGVFVTPNLASGSVVIESQAYQTNELGPSRFYNVYEGAYEPPYFHGDGDELTEFACRSRFLTSGGTEWKATFCARRYQRFPELHDSYLALASIGAPDQGVVVQARLTGVTEDKARRFSDKLIRTLKWTP